MFTAHSQRMNNTLFHNKTRFFFPQIGPRGFCNGYGKMAIPAILALDLKSYLLRTVHAYGGIPHPKEPDRIVSVPDLEALISELNLEKYYNPQNNNQKQIIFRPQDQPIKVDGILKKLYELLKDLGCGKYFHHVGTVMKATTNVRENRPAISPDELKKQIDLAWQIREAFIQKLQDELSEDLTLDITRQTTQRLNEFYKVYPHINELLNLEIHFSHLALYQAAHQFPFLFEQDKIPYAQSTKAVTPLLKPMILEENGIINLAKFTRRYSIDHLQIFFQTLELKIKEYSLENNDKTTMGELPLAITFLANGHTITVTYNSQNNKWIVIDSGQMPFVELETKDMGQYVFFTLLGLVKIPIECTNCSITIAHHSDSDEWLLIKLSHQTPLETEREPLIKEIIDKLVESKKLKEISNYQISLMAEVFTSESAKKIIAPAISSWLNDSPFRELIVITSSHVELTQGDLYQRRLLYYACAYGDFATAQMLIQMGANVNDQEQNKTVPLYLAITGDQRDIVRLLLRYGANPNHLLPNGISVFTQAVILGNIEIVRLCLEMGNVNINLVMQGCKTVITAAIERGYGEILELLLAHGAQTDLARYEQIEQSRIYQSSSYPHIKKILRKHREDLLKQNDQKQKKHQGEFFSREVEQKNIDSSKSQANFKI